MSLFKKFGQPVATKTEKPKTSKERLAEAVKKQERLLAGEQVLSPRNTPIASWFSKGKFSPKLGNKSLFGKKFYVYEDGQQQDYLTAFVESLKSGELDEYIEKIEVGASTINAEQ